MYVEQVVYTYFIHLLLDRNKLSHTVCQYEPIDRSLEVRIYSIHGKKYQVTTAKEYSIVYNYKDNLIVNNSLC